MWRIALLALSGSVAWAAAATSAFAEPAETTANPAAAAEAPPLLAAVPKIHLQEALAEALRREIRISIAQAQLARAQALVTRARAGWLPSVIGHASYLRLGKDRRLNGTLLSARDQVLADLTVSVPIVSIKPWFETGRAEDAVEVAQLDQEQVRRRVALSTAQAYLTVIAQHRSLDVQTRALENAEAHGNYAHTRFAGGIGNQIDDVRASQEVETNRAALLRTRAALYAAEEALGVLVGRDSPLDAADDEVKLAAPPTLEKALAELPELRADLRANAARVRVSERTVDDNWAEYAPLLAAQGQPFFHEPGTPSQPRTGWQIQLLLTVPFYDAGARSSLFEQRAANLQQDRAQLEATVRQARSEVRVALSAVKQADASLNASQRASELAAQALQMANVAYEAGASTNLEVIDAERRARDAATTVVVAEDAARQARLDLLAASGRFP
ncbi:MAG TPA: TolC family protein [Polyangiales bacterium]|nr:TolC family protein [Polyangiales bacterium]